VTEANHENLSQEDRIPDKVSKQQLTVLLILYAVSILIC
jgi:hypothetical protein